MAKTIGVGIIGASADRGWAKISHVPAVQALDGFELAAVASGSKAKGEAAAKAFDAKAGYGTGQDLIRDPGVDLVSICVKVPDHRELVLSALEAGKHIYCEWPLGRNLAESTELAVAAQDAGVHVAIGLQTRMNNAARHAKDLLASGAIGQPLSASILSTTAAFGRNVERAMAFAEDVANGVTLINIQGAHTLDTAIALLGEFSGVNAMNTTQFPIVEVGEEHSRQTRSIPDHMLVQARLATGIPLSVETAGGRPPETATFQFIVNGEKGVLCLYGGALRGFQSGRLHVSVQGKQQHVPENEMESLPEEAVNVAGMYAALRTDILNDTSTVPDFHHAVRLAKLVEDVTTSAQTGVQKSADGWPT